MLLSQAYYYNSVVDKDLWLWSNETLIQWNLDFIVMTAAAAADDDGDDDDEEEDYDDAWKQCILVIQLTRIHHALMIMHSWGAASHIASR